MGTNCNAAPEIWSQPEKPLRARGLPGDRRALQPARARPYVGMSNAQPPAGWYPRMGARYWRGLVDRPPAAAAVVVPGVPVVVTDAHVSGVEVAFAWVLTVLTGGYLLPWAIAATRGKSNSGRSRWSTCCWAGRWSAGSSRW